MAENVRSTAPGTVVFAGNEGAGKVVRIEHNYGISTPMRTSRASPSSR